MAHRRLKGASGSYDIRELWRSLIEIPLYGRAVAIALLCGGCTPNRPPPPTLMFAGLPVSGNLDAAVRSGFTYCFNMDAINLRCRRHGIMFYGHGPYEAAVDLRGGYGESGFNHLTIWHDNDHEALYEVLVPLYREGWRFCHTGIGHAGDQAIFTHKNIPFRISLDISFYGKRRLRVFPTSSPQRLSSACIPAEGLGMFNLNV
jgi:hypothetical protein